MKQYARILSIVLIICMLAASFVFGATPSASLVSPVEDSIIADDELLISVKVLDKKKISVMIFEEKLVSLDKEGEPILDKDEKEVLVAYDVKDAKKEDFKEIKKNFEDEKFKEVKVVTDAAVYTAVGEVGYFTKTIEKLDPGLYRIQVEVLDKEDKASETYSSFVILQEKPEEDAKEEKEKSESKTVTVEASKNSLVKSIKKIIKSIIK